MELGQTCPTNDDKFYEWVLQNRPGHENDGGLVWGPEGRLFMFQRHFDVYNHRGMSAEDLLHSFGLVSILPTCWGSENECYHVAQIGDVVFSRRNYFSSNVVLVHVFLVDADGRALL